MEPSIEQKLEAFGEEIKKLKDEIEALKSAQKPEIHHHYPPNYQMPQIQYHQNPPSHWHNGQPCWQNPCVWC